MNTPCCGPGTVSEEIHIRKKYTTNKDNVSSWWLKKMKENLIELHSRKVKNIHLQDFKTILQLQFNKEAHTCRLVWHGRPYQLASST